MSDIKKFLKDYEEMLNDKWTIVYAMKKPKDEYGVIYFFNPKYGKFEFKLPEDEYNEIKNRLKKMNITLFSW